MTEPAAVSSTTTQRSSRRWGLSLSVVLLVGGVIASVLLYELKRDLQRLENQTRSHLAALQEQLTDVARLKEAQLTSNQQREAIFAGMGALQSRADQSDANYARLTALVQGGQRQWQLAEVEQLLLIANDRLLLHRDATGALRALEIADSRLREIADTQGLIELRQQVANDLAALKAVPQADVQGLTLKLNALIERVPRLPLTSSVPRNFTKVTSGDELPQVDSRWRRFLDSALTALRGLVEIHHRDQQVIPLLPPGQEFFLYQNLQLKLESARLALLQRDTASFKEAVKLAAGWIRAYFTPEDSAVKAALEELTELERVELNWPLPDLSGSLQRARTLLAKQTAERPREAPR